MRCSSLLQRTATVPKVDDDVDTLVAKKRHFQRTFMFIIRPPFGCCNSVNIMCPSDDNDLKVKSNELPLVPAEMNANDVKHA